MAACSLAPLAPVRPHGRPVGPGRLRQDRLADALYPSAGGGHRHPLQAGGRQGSRRAPAALRG
eukprot:13762360-Alexandrium_andersonii.AAC.1